MSFVHLHNHTEFSLLDGMARVEESIQKAKELGMPALAITDHGALYGAFKFFLKAKEYGVKPIIGVEAYKAKNSRFDKQISIDRDQNHLILLEKNGEGLIALSGCLKGELPQLIMENQTTEADKVLKKYLQIFGKNFYIEIQRHPKMPELDSVNEQLIKLSRKHAVPLVATNDVHYINKDDAYAQEILLCIQTQRTILENNRPLSMYNNPDFYFKSASEMKGQFLDLPEAIDNTVKIAEECNLEIPYGNWILPRFETPKGETAAQYLKELVEKKAHRLKDSKGKEVQDRTKYELDIITSKGYSTYFLIVQDRSEE